MFQEQLEKLKSYKLADLLREGNDISFAELSVQIKAILDFLTIYYENESVRTSYTQSEASTVNDIYSEAVSVFDQIVTTSDWGSIQTSTIQDIRNRVLNQFNNITATNYYARAQAALALELQKTDSTAKKRKEAQDLLNYIRRQAKAIDENVDKSKTALARTIETSYGTVFDKRADNYGDVAKNWLRALVIVLAIYSLFAGWLIYKLVDKNISDINGVSAIFKLAALLGGLYLISILNRNYSTNKHLEVVNRHRGSIFAVINDLVDAQKDEANKQFLLAYGAKVIFDMGETGFISRNYGAGTDEDGILTPLLEKLSKVK